MQTRACGESDTGSARSALCTADGPGLTGQYRLRSGGLEVDPQGTQVGSLRSARRGAVSLDQKAAPTL
jgi:hypothetical protein